MAFENGSHWTSADGLVSKTVVSKGSVEQLPQEGAVCRIVLKLLNVEPLEPEALRSAYFHKDFSGVLSVGEGDTDVDRCLDRCVCIMRPRETSEFVVKFVRWEGPTTVRCVITLEAVARLPPLHELTTEQKYQKVNYHRGNGVKLFEEGRIHDAFYRFSKALKLLVTLYTDAENPSFVSTKTALYNNLAVCHLRQENYDSVLVLCDKILELEPTNVKALYKRSVSFLQLQEFEKAELDLKNAASIEPLNKAVKAKLELLRQKKKEYDAKLSGALKKMFV